MNDNEHWLVGPHFDLYDTVNRALATRGAIDGLLSEVEVRQLCRAVLRHAARHDLVMETIAKTMH